MSLVNTETGEVRSHVVRDVTGATLGPILRDEVDTANAVLHTDTAAAYVPVGREFTAHESVNHFQGEYVRGKVSTTPPRATSHSSSGPSTAPITRLAPSTWPATSRSSTTATAPAG